MDKIKTYKLFLESNVDSDVSVWLSETIDLIKKDCQPFLEDLKDSGVFSDLLSRNRTQVFYRGVMFLIGFTFIRYMK